MHEGSVVKGEEEEEEEEGGREGGRKEGVALACRFCQSVLPSSILPLSPHPFLLPLPVSRYEVNFQEGLSCGGAYIKLLLDAQDLVREEGGGRRRRRRRRGRGRGRGEGGGGGGGRRRRRRGRGEGGGGGGEEGGGATLLAAVNKHVTVSSLQTAFNDKTPYSIMFGPDKCGMSSKVRGER